jgi:hypothetical protein
MGAWERNLIDMGYSFHLSVFDLEVRNNTLQKRADGLKYRADLADCRMYIAKSLCMVSDVDLIQIGYLVNTDQFWLALTEKVNFLLFSKEELAEIVRISYSAHVCRAVILATDYFSEKELLERGIKFQVPMVWRALWSKFSVKSLNKILQKCSDEVRKAILTLGNITRTQAFEIASILGYRVNTQLELVPIRIVA